MLMDKVKVNGGDSSPVFKFLKNRVGQVLPIKWNFDGKYLVRKDGMTVTRYSATQNPLSFEADIKAALNE